MSLFSVVPLLWYFFCVIFVVTLCWFCVEFVCNLCRQIYDEYRQCQYLSTKKMEKKTNLKLRIIESANYFSISVREFEKKCNINRGTLGSIKEEQSINSNILAKIIDNAPQINIVWLITGKGKMILNTSEIEQNTVQEEKIEYGKKDIVAEYLIKRINDLEKEIEDLKSKHHNR